MRAICADGESAVHKLLANKKNSTRLLELLIADDHSPSLLVPALSATDWRADAWQIKAILGNGQVTHSRLNYNPID